LPAHFSRAEYELTQILPLIPILLIAIAFFYLGRRDQERQLSTTDRTV
jgi:hypothetical protein